MVLLVLTANFPHCFFMLLLKCSIARVSNMRYNAFYTDIERWGYVVFHMKREQLSPSYLQPMQYIIENPIKWSYFIGVKNRCIMVSLKLLAINSIIFLLWMLLIRSTINSELFDFELDIIIIKSGGNNMLHLVVSMFYINVVCYVLCLNVMFYICFSFKILLK